MKWILMVGAMLLAPVLSAQMGFGSDDDESLVDACLKLADANKDKVITADEVRTLRNKYFDAMKEAAKEKDEDKRDDKIDATEMEYEDAFELMMPCVFAALDKNQDHKLTKAELETYESGDWEDVSSDKVMKWVLEEEFKIASDVYGDGKGKELDADALKAMAAESGWTLGVDEIGWWIYPTLDETLSEFENQAEREKLEAEGEESGIEKKDLSKVTVKQKDFVKDGLKLWKEELKRAKDPEVQKKAAEDARKAEEAKKKKEAERAKRLKERKKD
ncbi:MAG: hypothetical protein KDB82_08440 [Planctomycetes bacterium]|nr:hypothetical protein [Planctomycetota bacterium]